MAARRTAKKTATERREVPADAGILLVGIDCATVAENTGFAVGSLDPADPTRVRIHEARGFAKGDDLAGAVLATIGERPALLGLDAPLGWPKPLGETLSWHEAGVPFGSPLVPDDVMFSRETDLQIRKRFGKRPLEVGADRIARTARAALRMLGDLDARRGKPVPLGWKAGPPDGVQALEVYPAATLLAHRIPSAGYRQQPAARKKVLRALSKQLVLPKGLDRTLAANPHALDAVLCVLAAADYLRGDAVGPTVEQMMLSRREGWIWVRPAE